MIRTLSILLFLAAGPLPAQQSTQQTEGAAGTAPPAAAPAEQPPKTDPKDDIGGGLLKVAKEKKAALEALEAKNLPEVDKLGRAQPCANARPIARNVEAVRAAANDWFAAYVNYLETWSKYTLRDIDENKKWWADMAARKGDIPAAIKSEEEAIREYERRRGNLAAEDEETRREYDTLIKKAQAKLDQLLSAGKDADEFEKSKKLSEEYWGVKLESIKKDGELVEAARKAYHERYDAIVQHWKTVCTILNTPTTIDDVKPTYGVKKD